MYEIIKNVIDSGRYELSDMLKKIDTIWLQGDLTEEQKEELVNLAREKATPDMGYAKLEERMTDIEKRVEALEKSGEETEEEYPAWKKPGSAKDAYYTDMKMTYTDGKRYICTAPVGYAVTYGPDVLPNMWEKVTQGTQEVVE